MSVFPFALRLTCYCWIAYFIFLNLTSHALPEQQHTSNFYRYLGENAPARSPIIKDVDLFINGDEDDDEELLGDDLDDDYLNITGIAGKGQFLGSPCDETCNPMLQHVYCDTDKGICDCENLHPVRLGPKKGCAKPKKLGEQCYYRLTCAFVDEHATCTQVQHNAVCDCEEGYHKVIMSKGGRKSFCARDLVIITTDLSTFLAIISGIAVFTGLICFVLKLFNRGRYIETPTHFTSAARVPPMYFSRDTGIPSTLQERPPSRSSQRSNSGPLTCAYPRRPSSGANRAPVAATSRAGAARAAAILLMSCHRQSIKGASKHRRALSDVAEGSTDGLGSRRPSLASVHSSASSAKSFSAKRLERERNEKEQRQALQELKLSRQREKESQEQVAPTPSPRTPHSTDELLPSVEEGKETTYNQVPSVSGVENTTLMTTSIALSNEITPVVTTPLFDRDIISCTSKEALKL